MSELGVDIAAARALLAPAVDPRPRRVRAVAGGDVDGQEPRVNPLWVRGDRVEALDALAVWHD